MSYESRLELTRNSKGELRISIPEPEARLSASQCKSIFRALDLLGSALADHGHEWSDEERQAYEDAFRELWKREATHSEPITSGRPSSRKGDPCVGPHMGREVAVSHLSDRELNERICQELQKMRDELHGLRDHHQEAVNRCNRRCGSAV